MRKSLIPAALALFLLALPCAAQAQTPLDVIPFESIGPLALGMDMEQARALLGDPDETHDAASLLSNTRTGSIYELVPFDTEWRFPSDNNAFYKVFFKDGKVVLFMCTYRRTAQAHTLMYNGAPLPPMDRAGVTALFGPPDEEGLTDKFNGLTYVQGDRRMTFAIHPSGTPVGVMIYSPK